MPCHGRDIGLRHKRVGEEKVGPGLRVQREAAQHFGQPMGREGIGARHQDEGRIAARVPIACTFSTISSAAMTSFPCMCPQRRPGLVFNHQARDACLLKARVVWYTLTALP